MLPAERVRECSDILASQFKDTQVYRLTEPEAVPYRQVVLFATRRNRREREPLRDDDIVRRRAQFTGVGNQYGQLATLTDNTSPLYSVPESGPAKLEYRGLPLDQIEDLLPPSPAYRQAARILFAEPTTISGRRSTQAISRF